MMQPTGLLSKEQKLKNYNLTRKTWNNEQTL